MTRFNRRKVMLSTLSLSALPFLARGAARATTPADKSVTQPAILVRSEQFRLKSDAGREFVIQIARPHDVVPELELMVRGRKPVTIFVLDGDSTFGMVADMTRMMQWGGDVPPC